MAAKRSSSGRRCTRGDGTDMVFVDDSSLTGVIEGPTTTVPSWRSCA